MAQLVLLFSLGKWFKFQVRWQNQWCSFTMAGSFIEKIYGTRPTLLLVTQIDKFVMHFGPNGTISGDHSPMLVIFLKCWMTQLVVLFYLGLQFFQSYDGIISGTLLSMSILLFRSQMAQLVVLFCLGLSFIDKLYGTISGALKPRPVVMFESEKVRWNNQLFCLGQK